MREADEKFMECLNHEMLENKTCGVAPIVVTVRLSDDEQFDMKHSEAYTYDTIGGNHSRIALQQLIKENQELAKDQHFRLAESLCTEDCQLSKRSILLIGIIVLRNLPAR